MSPRRFAALTSILILQVAGALGPGVEPAFAACGGGPCGCGSVVTTDTTLNEAIDPVCSTGPLDTCGAVGGLIVNAGIVLDLGGCTLRGAPGAAVGIVAQGGNKVRSGRIIGFANGGVFVFGAGSLVSNLQISDGGGSGVFVSGNSNTVEKLIVRRQGGDCVTVIGEDNRVADLQALDCRFTGVATVGPRNTVENSKALRNGASGISVNGSGSAARSNRADDNGSQGVEASGSGVVIARNTTLRNGQCGIALLGGGTSTNGLIDRNQSKYTGAFNAGICVQGTGHTVTRNIVTGNHDDGIFVFPGGGHLFDRNRSTANGGFGIVDVTVGGGTGGTASTYKGNLCSGNHRGDSDPAGLCR